MSFGTMITELTGSIPKLPKPYAGTLINRAWRDVRERHLWSFNLFEGQWIAPPQINVGTVTVTQGSPIVTLDDQASLGVAAALAAQPYSTLIQRQFRAGSPGASAVYNIFSFNIAGYGEGGYGSGPYGGGTNTLVLDRPFGETSGAGLSYFIYQCYYVAQDRSGPITDFLTWISVRNIQNFIDLYTERLTRAQLDALDPQRYSFTFPTDVVPYQIDQNPLSSTFRSMMFELWGGPLSNWTYQLMGLRKGSDLVKLTDTLPYAVGEDCVLAKARVYAYEWAEANKDMSPRSSGPDFKFLMGAAQKEHSGLLANYRRQDREIVDNYFSVRRSAQATLAYGYYNSISGTANPGYL